MSFFTSNHHHVLPEGVRNPAILFHYNLAKSKQLYPENAYLMINEKEFFAASPAPCQLPPGADVPLFPSGRNVPFGHIATSAKGASLFVPVPIGLHAARRDWNETSPPKFSASRRGHSNNARGAQEFVVSAA